MNTSTTREMSIILSDEQFGGERGKRHNNCLSIKKPGSRVRPRKDILLVTAKLHRFMVHADLACRIWLPGGTRMVMR